MSRLVSLIHPQAVVAQYTERLVRNVAFVRRSLMISGNPRITFLSVHFSAAESSLLRYKLLTAFWFAHDLLLVKI
jgi:hypothetical protein